MKLRYLGKDRGKGDGLLFIEGDRNKVAGTRAHHRSLAFPLRRGFPQGGQSLLYLSHVHGDRRAEIRNFV